MEGAVCGDGIGDGLSKGDLGGSFSSSEDGGVLGMVFDQGLIGENELINQYFTSAYGMSPTDLLDVFHTLTQSGRSKYDNAYNECSSDRFLYHLL
jgi:hypothetical protein